MKKDFKFLLKEALKEFQNGNFKRSESIFLNLLNQNPKYLELYTYLIPSLINQNKLSEAEKYSRDLFMLSPNLKEASLIYLGVISQKLMRYEESCDFFHQALNINPENYQALLNLGVAYHKLNNNLKAIEFTRKSIIVNKYNSIAYQNIASYLEDENRLEEAINYLKEAININKNDYDALHALSLLQLLTLDYANGLENFEKRFLTSHQQDRYSHIPRLDTETDIKDKKILIWHEQGLGDTIQFSIFVKKIIGLGGIVTLVVQRPLQKFLSMQFDCEVTYQLNHTEFDYQIPIMSLMRYFKINNKTIYAKSYNFCSDNHKILFWKERLNLSKEKLNIGLSTTGNKKHKKEYRRRIDLNKFVELTDQFKIFLIQKDITPQERLIINNNNEITFLGDDANWEDFTDTSAIVSNMKFVVSIDTSLIHLAGAMNKKSYLLLSKPPDWRWGNDSNHEINWYDSVNIIRQTSVGDWDDVLEKLKSLLKLEK